MDHKRLMSDHSGIQMMQPQNQLEEVLEDQGGPAWGIRALG